MSMTIERYDQDSRKVRLWADHVGMELDMARRWLARQPDRSYVHQLRAERAEALLAVLESGLDPTRPRGFAAPVLLEVRCEARGHTLGRVYDSGTLPVFVPSVSEQPLYPLDDDERWERRRLRREDEAAGRMLGGLVTEVNFPWITQFCHTEGERVFFEYEVVGTYVIDDDRRANLTALGRRIGAQLQCRCGVRYVYTEDVITALDRRQSTLSA